MKNRLHSFAMRTILVTALFASFLSAHSQARLSDGQVVRKCGTMENLERLKALDPELEVRMSEIEKQTRDLISSSSIMKGNDPITNGTIYKIPVVVHIVYNTSSQNITDAQVQSQITVLNEDYRRLNADKSNTPSAFSSVAADAEIEFCLATVSPSGGATTGIIRKSTSSTSFIDDDKVKYSSSGGDDAWPASSYLNLWVCNLGGGLLGYAQFPGGASATDGVVINYQYFGRGGSAGAPYDLGRTATHEVGHWFNLHHIWGDANCGDDLVSDTPTQQTSNYGCPGFPHTTCSNGSNGDMFMNYMDYTDDGCMNMFSLGQKSRMRALFGTSGARVSILSSGGCGGSSTPAYCSANGNSVAYEYINNVTLNTINNTTGATSGGYANYTSTSTSLAKSSAYTISLKPGFVSSSYTEYFKVYIDYNNNMDFSDAGEDVYTSSGSSSTVSGSFTIPSAAITGTVRMRVMMSDSPISSSCGSYNYGEVEDYSINITTGSSSSCGLPSALSATSITSSSATLNWGSVSGASSYNVKYKPTSSSTWTNTTSTSTSKSVSGLSASTQYEFQVQAVCSVTGSFSASSYFTTSGSSTSTSNTVQVGTGTGTVYANPYGTYYMDERVQYILTQSELAAAGFTSSNSYIKSLAFYATSSSGQIMNGFTIRVRHTTATSFGSSSFLSSSNMTTVYSGNPVVTASAWNTYNFSTAFQYNGTDNLLVEICWSNSSYTSNSYVQYTATSSYRTLYYRADAGSAGVCGNTTGTQSYNRPNIKMVFSSTAAKSSGSRMMEDFSAPEYFITNLAVYPNPASSDVSLTFSVEAGVDMKISVMDMLGRMVMDKKYSAAEGANTISMDVSSFNEGIYILTINDDKNSEKRRLIISR
ncbi:MAG: T9SS type A sorting domain-containing protein [Bacteroidetes bacterium]|nr:T9SS type A sorting domain-containing protein [Bacteroidota bacterium]